MAMREYGPVKLHVARGGSAAEIKRFIADIEQAYEALLNLDKLLQQWRRRVRWYPFDLLPLEFVLGADHRFLLPNEMLQITAVEFSSPGAWEFFGSLNPLQQIREYLKDRHERRKDRDWREASESERMRLENDLLRQRVENERIAGARQMYELFKDAGAPNDELQRLLWSKIGIPLANVGRHQDSGLLTDQSGKHKDDQ